MKKTWKWMGGLALGMAFLLSACGEDNAYTNALPKDAAAVFSFDLMEMAQKCDLNDQVKQSMGQMMKSSLKGSADALVDKLMENPEESGLRLTDRVYFFAASQMEMGGVLVRMADKGKLEDLMAMLQEQKACEAPADGDGCRWTVGGGGLMAWTDDAFLMLAGNGNPKDLQHQASMWLRQKEGEGYSGTPEFKKLEDADEDVAMVTSLNAMPKSYLGPVTMGLPADLNLNDLKIFSTLDFQAGKAVMEVETLLEGKFKDLLKKQAEVSGELDGTYLKVFPANTVCWMAANVNGEKVYELLRENPTVRQELDNSMMPLDFEAIFKAVKGDVALAMPEMSLKPGFILYADVKNGDFMRTFEDLKPMLAMTNGQMQLVDKGENAYQFVAANGAMLGMGRGPVSFWLGVKDERFYLTNQEDLIGREVKGLSLKDCDWAKDVKDKHFYLNVNFQALSAVLPQISYISMLDYLSIESDEPTKARLVLQLKDHKENVLKQLVQIVNN
jgi:hypothetical protein